MQFMTFSHQVKLVHQYSIKTAHHKGHIFLCRGTQRILKFHPIQLFENFYMVLMHLLKLDDFF